MKKLLLGLIITIIAITPGGFNALAANDKIQSAGKNEVGAVSDSVFEEEFALSNDEEISSFDTADIEDLRDFYTDWLEAEREFLDEVNVENVEVKDLQDNLTAIENKITALTATDLEAKIQEIDSDFNAYQSALEANTELDLILIETPEEMKIFYQDLIQDEETMYSELQASDIKTDALEADLAQIRSLVNSLAAENSDWSDPLYEKIDTALDNYYQKLDDFFAANFETFEIEEEESASELQ